MKANVRKIGSRVASLALSLVCGMALTTSSARAQGFGFPNSPFTPAQQVGAVVSMPLAAYGSFVTANVLRQKNVNFLNFSQTAIGDGNVGLITASVKQWNGAPTTKCFVPVPWLNTIKQINNNRISVDQLAQGNGNVQVAQVDVQQGNQAVPLGTHFCMIPAKDLGTVLQVNKNVTSISQVAVGDGNQQLALVGVSQNNQMLVPTSSLATIQINTNVTIINQVAVGNGNLQLAQVSVGQANI
jgi:hypothetical protein